jgi:hypothetical protein
MSQLPVTVSPLAINIIAINPEARFREVIKLGICLVII